MIFSLLAAVLPSVAVAAPPAPAPSCYAGAADGAVHSLAANRDRLIADLARRKATDSCALWASLNKGERYVFLMDTAYLGDKSSRLFPPGGSLETALDHATALYSINGPKAGQGVDHSGRGGREYNRAYLGFDALAACVMRNTAAANPSRDPGFNQWRKSDDSEGPHAPFNAREMIFWASWPRDESSNSLGPQMHHWRTDSDFNQAGVNKRVGVCGVNDPTLTELTIAFDFFHNSNPLGDYAGRGGYGWQIVDKNVSLDAAWDYAPTGCPASAPLNDDPSGGGTFNGLGPKADGRACASPAE